MNEENKNTEVIQAEEDTGNNSPIEFDVNPSGVIFEILRNGKIAYVSSGLEQITGYSIPHVIGTDINEFLQRLLGEDSAKQLWPLVAEVLRGSRRFLESNVQAPHPDTDETSLFSIQLEASSENFNRAILFLQDLSVQQDFDQHLNFAQLSSMRILEKGNLIFLRSDVKLQINEVLGDTEKILGISSLELEEKPDLWLELLEEEDYKSLNKAFYRLIKKPRSFTKEIRFNHAKTEKTCWLLFSAVPVFDQDQLVGWEGFGLDITHKKQTELELHKQTRRYNSLYKVLESYQNIQPTSAAAVNALDAILKPTGTSAGAIWYGDHLDDRYELLAAKGFSAEVLQELDLYQTRKKNLLTAVTKKSCGLILQDLSKEAKAYGLEFLSEHYKAIMAVPLLAKISPEKQIVVGVLLLAGKSKQLFTNNDLDLVTTAANQMALSSYQSEYAAAERRQASSVNVLYRLSRRLTQVMKPEEVADSAFPLIEEEFRTKRIWMGVMNDSGSHILGVAGTGPGMRAKVNTVQIELGLRHDFLDQAINEKKPILYNRDDKPECSKLNKLIEAFNPTELLIVPMVSIGQVVGVLVIEPQEKMNMRLAGKLSLLSSIASEMAAAILSRRFELQIAKADKMRMAGLLVSGVAHNFNNLLQAVIGQASLLEAKLSDDKELHAAAGNIVTSAKKGAELIKKMAFVSESAMANPALFDLSNLIKASKKSFVDSVGKTAKFNLEIDSSSYPVVGDYFNIQQVLSSLLANAIEAVQVRGIKDSTISIKVSDQEVLTGEVSQDLAPGYYARIDIIDQGIGMDAIQLERCFEPFYTTKDFDENTGVGYSGSGLSLANAYNIITQHGGLIVASSQLNQGTTFSIFLPLNRNKTEKIAEHSNEINERLAVVIGDHSEINKKCFKILRELGFNLLEIRHRNEIMPYLSKPDFSPEFVVIDLDRARSDVIEFFKLLKEHYSKTKIIAYTSDEKTWKDLLRFFEGILIIEKPGSAVDFHQGLKRLLSSEKKYSLLDQIEVERVHEKKAGAKGNGNGKSK